MIKIKNLFWPLTKRKIVFTLIVLAIVGIAAWTYSAFFAPPLPQEHSKFRQDLNSLFINAKYTEIEARLKKYLKEPLTDEQRYDASLMMGVNYMNLGNKREALKWYRQCFELDENGTPDVAYGIAGILLEDGDKATAIEFYKKGIALARVDVDPFNDAFIVNYERLIKSLEAGQALPSGPGVPPPGHAPPPSQLPGSPPNGGNQ